MITHIMDLHSAWYMGDVQIFFSHIPTSIPVSALKVYFSGRPYYF